MILAHAQVRTTALEPELIPIIQKELSHLCQLIPISLYFPLNFQCAVFYVSHVNTKSYVCFLISNLVTGLFLAGLFSFTKLYNKISVHLPHRDMYDLEQFT